MININIHNETAQLQAVLVGIANDFGGTPRVEDCYDPKSKEHVIAGTYPAEQDLVRELDGLCRILKNNNVRVFRPKNIKGLNQIFTRDIAFAIEGKLVLPNIIPDRKTETKAIQGISVRPAANRKVEHRRTDKYSRICGLPWIITQ